MRRERNERNELHSIDRGGYRLLVESGSVPRSNGDTDAVTA